MSYNSNSELLLEAAGHKIFMTPFDENDAQPPSEDMAHRRKLIITLPKVKEVGSSETTRGFHLTKTKWDPYPWISYVQAASLADSAGLRSGDCLINIDNVDILGLKIQEIADLIRRRDQEADVKLSVWRHPHQAKQKEIGLALSGPLPEVARRLANATSSVVHALECPVCLESSMPPVSQCVHGHIICTECRLKTTRCPVCRVKLGQGRCLLADKVHRILCDTFSSTDAKSDDPKIGTLSLLHRLFGKEKKKQISTHTSKNNNFPKPRQLLLTKLLFGSLEKAASVDDLTNVAKMKQNVPIMSGTSRCDYNLNERLGVQDRVKSASIGELMADRCSLESSSQSIPRNDGQSNSAHLSPISSNTPVWGGSEDSIFSPNLACPLSNHNKCSEILAPDGILQHLSLTHDVPQIHFHSANVKIPLPLPFGLEAVYVLHYAGQLFFFQYERESCWITCGTSGSGAWKWLFHGHGNDGTELKTWKTVASLEHPIVVSTEHIVTLSDTLQLHTMNIQLTELKSAEALDL